MSNPNTVTVFSPEGEPFEMSRVNARDLVSHAGWTNSPSGTTPAPKAVEEEAETETQTEDDADASATSTGSDEASDEATSEDEAGEASDEAETAEEEVTSDDEPFFAVLTTEADFAILTERQHVVDYLAHFFPAFKPHHKSSRDGLVAKALELQAAAAE